MLRGVAAAAAVLIALALAPAGAAKTYKVTKRTDPVPGSCTASDCSLREAIRAANATIGVADTIVLPSTKVYTLTQAGTDEDGAMTGDLDITNNRLRIVHPGKGKATIDAGDLDRVFEVFVGAPATFEKLVIRNGNATGISGYGGGIRGFGKVTLLSSTVKGNQAAGCGGGIHMQSGGQLVVRGSVVTRNRAVADGGGISASCFGGSGKVTITSSTVSRNRADSDDNGVGRGGGIYLQTSAGIQSTFTRTTWSANRAGSEGGGIYTDSGRLRIAGSTVSGNRAGDNGGGIEVDGTDPFVAVNTTVAGNRSDSQGGGIHADGNVVRLNAVTIVRNRGNADGLGSEVGGGIVDTGSLSFSVENSLIALNTLAPFVVGDPPIKSDCASVDPFTSLGHNLLSTRFLCNGFTKASDRARANPKLGTLGNHGGPTKTVPLLAGSPALNKAGASAPSRDQRGKKRGAKPDIGAYERT
jgi:CSLREA domain-containing protein